MDFVGRLRAARALVLRDSEAFHEASTVLEHIGQVTGGIIGNGLKDYEGSIVGIAKSAAHSEEAVCRLFNVVREARNKAVHDGALCQTSEQPPCGAFVNSGGSYYDKYGSGRGSNGEDAGLCRAMAPRFACAQDDARELFQLDSNLAGQGTGPQVDTPARCLINEMDSERAG